MSKKPSPTVVGGFVLGGLALVLAAIALWGSGRLLERKYRYVCYFPGSVNGLSVGAPVKYRGVPIGSVVEMRVIFEQSIEDTRIPVVIELYGKRVKELGVRREPNPQLVKELVERGLRARLESQSLVTGQLYVNFDIFPDSAVVLNERDEHTYPEIPTIPTTMEEATKSLSMLLDKLKDTDLTGFARSIDHAVDGISKLVNSPAIGTTLRELPSAVLAFREAARELGTAAGGVRETIGARGTVLLSLERTLVEVQRAAESIRVLADFLQRNPNALIVGKKRP
ncbi:MAG: MlaD family protein [Polyangia bacterium]